MFDRGRFIAGIDRQRGAQPFNGVLILGESPAEGMSPYGKAFPLRNDGVPRHKATAKLLNEYRFPREYFNNAVRINALSKPPKRHDEIVLELGIGSLGEAEKRRRVRQYLNAEAMKDSVPRVALALEVLSPFAVVAFGVEAYRAVKLVNEGCFFDEDIDKASQINFYADSHTSFFAHPAACFYRDDGGQAAADARGFWEPWRSLFAGEYDPTSAHLRFEPWAMEGKALGVPVVPTKSALSR